MIEMFPIYCDGTLHHPRRVLVTRFRRAPDGSWHEKPSRRAGATAGSGYTLHGDSLDRAGWALDPEVSGDHRVNFRFQCGKCGERGHVAANAPKLYAALTRAWPERGVSGATLVELAAILRMQAES